MSAADTNEPSAAKKAMLSGSGVSRIQNCPVVGSSQTNTMPSAPPRSVTPISPRAARPAVSASHRHTSHVEPSAAVTRRRRCEPGRHDAAWSSARRVASSAVRSTAGRGRSCRGRVRPATAVEPPSSAPRTVVVTPHAATRGRAAPPPSGAATTSAVTVRVASPRAGHVDLRELRGRRGRALRRPPPVRHAGRLGHAGPRGHARRGRAVVLLVPARTTRTCLVRGLTPSAAADGQHAAQVVPAARDARLDDVGRQLLVAAVERAHLLGRRHALAVRRQPRPEHVGDEAQLRPRRRSGTASSLGADVLGRPDQLGVGVADLVLAEPPALVLVDEVLAGEPVVDLPAPVPAPRSASTAGSSPSEASQHRPAPERSRSPPMPAARRRTLART